MEKEGLSRECGVAVRSIEYWFWARNKKLRADPDAFSPGGSRQTTIMSPPNPENHWSSWDPKRAREDDATNNSPVATATSAEDEWMAEPVHDGKRPAAAPVAAGADSLLSSGSAPQQLQDLLGNAASGFPNVEIPTISCAEQGQANAEESPLQIISAGTVAADGTSWTDGADSMEPGCWGWNEEHANGSDNADGKMRAHARCAPRQDTHGFCIDLRLCRLLCPQTTTATAHPSLCSYLLRLVGFLQKWAERHFTSPSAYSNAACTAVADSYGQGDVVLTVQSMWSQPAVGANALFKFFASKFSLFRVRVSSRRCRRANCLLLY